MVTKDGAAMSKSRGNVVDPDDMVENYGADTLRLFILFASPPEKEFAWNEKGIQGCFRFLNRMWTHFRENIDILEEEGLPEKGKDQTIPSQIRRKMHQTIKKVSEDIEKRYHLNTAISSLMEFFNQIKKERDILMASKEGKLLLREAMEALILLLSPFAPHICEELWERMGHPNYLIHTSWPSFDPHLAREEKVTIIVQVNGKLRDRFEVERDQPEAQIKEKALDLDRIQSYIKGKEIKKVIYIKDKLVNIVV
jgi:leucyl-tRNA synthetase